MNKKLLIGIACIVIGLILLTIGYSITGAVIGFSEKAPFGLIGLLVITGGVVLVFMARKVRYRDQRYNLIATRVYEILAKRGARGHHTERIPELERKISREKGIISARDVEKVIKIERENGRLRDGEYASSVSLPGSREAIDEIIEAYGSNLDETTIGRLEQLRDEHKMEGVRS